MSEAQNIETSKALDTLNEVMAELNNFDAYPGGGIAAGYQASELEKVKDFILALDSETTIMDLQRKIEQDAIRYQSRIDELAAERDALLDQQQDKEKVVDSALTKLRDMRKRIDEITA